MHANARPVVTARPANMPAPPGAGPLSPEDLRQLEAARKRAKSIRRAIGVARFNGWSVGLFAALSLLVGLFSLKSLLIGAVLAVVAYNEFAGARQLRCYDERAARRLGFNQIGLGVVLVVYAVWSICGAVAAPSSFEAALAAGDQATPLIGSIESLQTTVTLAVYGGLIIASIVIQGGTAWYYFTRGACIRAYRRDTPAWVLEVDRAQALP